MLFVLRNVSYFNVFEYLECRKWILRRKNPRTLNGKAKKVGVNVNNVEVRFWVETLNLHNNKKIPFSSRNSLGSIHNPFNLLPFTTEHFSVLFY